MSVRAEDDLREHLGAAASRRAVVRNRLKVSETSRHRRESGRYPAREAIWLLGHLNLGLILAARKSYDEAAGAFERASTYSPEFIDARGLLAYGVRQGGPTLGGPRGWHRSSRLLLKVDPLLDELRAEPRFQTLLRRMQFPE